MVGIFGWFRKRKELKQSQPKDWINEEYHIKVFKRQKELKRVLTKDELKQVHQETTKDVLDFVDKHLFKIS